jgi:hypothetical protein
LRSHGRVTAKQYVELLQKLAWGTITRVEASALFWEVTARVEMTTNRYYRNRDNLSAMATVHGNHDRIIERHQWRIDMFYEVFMDGYRRYEGKHRANRLLLYHTPNVLCHVPTKGIPYWVARWKFAFGLIESALQFRQDYGVVFAVTDLTKTPLKRYTELMGVIRKMREECVNVNETTIIQRYCKSAKTHHYVTELLEIITRREVEFNERYH